jgi:hypothetical protein
MGRAAPVSRMIVRTLSGTDAAIDWIAYRKIADSGQILHAR